MQVNSSCSDALVVAINEDHLADISTVPNYINAAVPFFFLLIFIEVCVALYRGNSSLYRFNDVIASISMGIVQQLSGIWYRSITIGPYIYLFRHYRLHTFSNDSLELHVLTLFLVDLCYYWFHRFAHEYHVVWAGHSVHHSGEDYNLPTALRQGALQPVFSWIFYLPLALIGIPPAMLLVHSQWNTLGQFWFHTSEIGRMGTLEYLLNTPAHHRMHHRPPGNCNYGGIFIIYDKLFGTFIPEDEQIDLYGLAKQLNTFDPVEANVSHFRRMRNIHRGANSTDEEQEESSWSSISRILRMLVSRRVKHAMLFHPQALLEEIPSSTYAARARGTSDFATSPIVLRRNMHRLKWNGALPDEHDVPEDFFAKFIFLGYLTTHFLIALSASYLVMLCVSEVELTFGLQGQPFLDIFSVDGIFQYVKCHKKQIFVTAMFFVCIHALQNIGRMSDLGARGVNDLRGEPGRLLVLVAFVHFLALRGTIKLSTCVGVSAALSIPWILVFHVTSGAFPRQKPKLL